MIVLSVAIENLHWRALELDRYHRRQVHWEIDEQHVLEWLVEVSLALRPLDRCTVSAEERRGHARSHQAEDLVSAVETLALEVLVRERSRSPDSVEIDTVHRRRLAHYKMGETCYTRNMDRSRNCSCTRKPFGRLNLWGTRSYAGNVVMKISCSREMHKYIFFISVAIKQAWPTGGKYLLVRVVKVFLCFSQLARCPSNTHDEWRDFLFLTLSVFSPFFIDAKENYNVDYTAKKQIILLIATWISLILS